MRLELGRPADAIRAAALAHVDQRAREAVEAIRPSWLAPVDALRAEQARLTLAGAADADQRALPLREGVDPRGAAAEVLLAMEDTAARLLAVEAWRLATKRAIRGARTVQEMRMLAEGVMA